jgi:hypothetical protein
MESIKKIGFLVSQLGPSQLCYDIIKNSNDYLANADDVDICLFWISDGHKPLEANFACMPLIEAYGYNGNIIVTDLHSLSRVMSYPGPNRASKIWFYDYNLDYTKIPAQMRSWEGLSQLYYHPKVELIARSQSHAEILNSVFREPKAIVENCNVSELCRIIYS